MTKKITSVQYFILRQAFAHMIDDLDTARMATAINVLRSGRGRYIDPDELLRDIQKSYKSIINSWGASESDGSLSVDLEKATTSIGLDGQYMLTINLEADPEDWEWSLNLPVALGSVEQEDLV